MSKTTVDKQVRSWLKMGYKTFCGPYRLNQKSTGLFELNALLLQITYQHHFWWVNLI
jgi:hypothetical protein